MNSQIGFHIHLNMQPMTLNLENFDNNKKGSIFRIGQASRMCVIGIVGYICIIYDWYKTLVVNKIKNRSCLSSNSRLTCASCFPTTPTTRSRMRLKVPWSLACMRQLGFLQGLKPGKSSTGFHSGWTDQSLLTFFGIFRTPLLFCCVNNWRMCRICESKTTTTLRSELKSFH